MPTVIGVSFSIFNFNYLYIYLGVGWGGGTTGDQNTHHNINTGVCEGS